VTKHVNRMRNARVRAHRAPQTVPSPLRAIRYTQRHAGRCTRSMDRRPRPGRRGLRRNEGTRKTTRRALPADCRSRAGSAPPPLRVCDLHAPAAKPSRAERRQDRRSARPASAPARRGPQPPNAIPGGRLLLRRRARTHTRSRIASRRRSHAHACTPVPAPPAETRHGTDRCATPPAAALRPARCGACASLRMHAPDDGRATTAWAGAGRGPRPACCLTG
jgi:hypothetical protein